MHGLRTLSANGDQRLSPRKLPSHHQLPPNIPRTEMHPPPAPHASRSKPLISPRLLLTSRPLGTMQPPYSTNAIVLDSTATNTSPPNKPPLPPPHRAPPPDILLHSPQRLGRNRNRPSAPRLAPHNHKNRLLPPGAARQNKSKPPPNLQSNLLRSPRPALPQHGLQTRHDASALPVLAEHRPRRAAEGASARRDVRTARGRRGVCAAGFVRAVEEPDVAAGEA